MLNLAIASSFLLSILAPGRGLLSLLVGAPVPHDIFSLHVWEDLHAGQRGIVIAIADYWLPAALLYVALRFIPQAMRFQPTRDERNVLAWCNIVVILFVIFRICIESGDERYLGLGMIIGFLLPWAMLVIGIVVVKVLIRGVRAKEATQLPHPVRLREGVAIALVGFGPSAFALETLYPIEESPFSTIAAAQKRFGELCLTAQERILRLPQEIEGVYYGGAISQGFEKVGPGEFVHRGGSSGWSPQYLLQTNQLQYYEAREYVRSSNDWQLLRVSLAALEQRQDKQEFVGLEKVPIDQVKSRYGIYFSSIVTPEDNSLKIQGHELGVKDLVSGESVASTRYFVNPNNRQVCADKNLEVLDTTGFLERALNLKR